MNSTNNAFLSSFGSTNNSGSGHQRSASVVGYYSDLGPPPGQVMVNGRVRVPNFHSQSVSNPYWALDSHKYPNTVVSTKKSSVYASYVDVSQKNGDSRKFSWHSSPNKRADSTRSTTLSNVQRPFEASFKSAISKMKESSISRLGNVEKTEPDHPSQPAPPYQERGYMTLQPSKSSTVHDFSDSGHTQKSVFRCSTSTSSSVVMPTSAAKEVVEPHIDQYQSGIIDEVARRQHKQQAAFTDLEQLPQTRSLDRKSGPTSRILIPVGSTKPLPPNKIVVAPSVKEETIVTSTASGKVMSAAPRTIITTTSRSEDSTTASGDAEADPNTEPLPSVQEIIAKVEALNKSPFGPRNTSYSEVIGMNVDSKPPHQQQQLIMKSRAEHILRRSCKVTEASLFSSSSPEQSKKKSGLYSKAPTSSSARMKTLTNIPSEFQKLHLAFLDQQKEIQRLRQELEEKKLVIGKLEKELRNYEPWR